MTIPDDQDSRHQSPVFFGYDLVKKPRSRGGALDDHEKPKREDFVVHRKGKPCPVCLVRKPGVGAGGVASYDLFALATALHSGGTLATPSLPTHPLTQAGNGADNEDNNRMTSNDD